MSTPTIPRVVATPAALALIARLRAEHGTICFYQSHGCCEGSTPMCFRDGEMPLTSEDRVLGHVGGVPFHASRAQADYLSGLQLTLDVAAGDSGSFSLEDGTGQRFVAHLRLWTDDEARRLALQPAPPPSLALAG